MDPDAESLEDYLGDFRFYLDFYTKQGPNGLEVQGPQRWRVKANWKIAAENFAGDMYHTPQTHTSVVEIGLFREPKAHKRKDGATYWAGRGGGTTYKLPEGSFEDRMSYVGYPEEMISRAKATWTEQQRQVVGADGFMISAATCFPNISFVHNWPKVEDGEHVLPFISIRVWQPISENETEVLSWFAVDSDAPEAFKAASYKAYLMCFGSTGMFEQDDVENWVSLTNTAGGSMARRLQLNSRMGLLADDARVVDTLSSAQFHGPGYAQLGYNENNQRQLLRLWADYLDMPPLRVDPATVLTDNPQGIEPMVQTNGRAVAGIDSESAPTSVCCDRQRSAHWSTHGPIGTRCARRPRPTCGGSLAVRRLSSPGGASLPRQRGVPSRCPRLRQVAGCSYRGHSLLHAGADHHRRRRRIR